MILAIHFKGNFNVCKLNKLRPFLVLHSAHVLRMPHRQKNDVAKQLKRRERIMVTPTRTNAKHVNLGENTILSL